jgi:hypothetical protein
MSGAAQGWLLTGKAREKGYRERLRKSQSNRSQPCLSGATLGWLLTGKASSRHVGKIIVAYSLACLQGLSVSLWSVNCP